MSHIPNSAMPRAGVANDESHRAGDESAGQGRFGALRDKAREHPRTAIAAGAAVAAGLVAAAAIPAIRSRGRAREE